jgi:hypothetical protein
MKRCELADIDVDLEGAALEAQQLAVGHRDDQKRAVRKPSKSRRPGGHFDHVLGPSTEIDRPHFVVVHVRKPKLLSSCHRGPSGKISPLSNDLSCAIACRLRDGREHSSVTWLPRQLKKGGRQLPISYKNRDFQIPRPE